MRTSARIRATTFAGYAIGIVCMGTLTMYAASAPLASQDQDAVQSATSTVVLDRVVAVVNNHAILSSDLDDEIRLSVLDPGVRQNCASDEGWKLFLTAHHLTPERVESYLRYRLEILRFIERRFRQGVRITPQEIETYYHDTLLPQYRQGDAIPTLDKVSPRIQEILLQQKVNILFDDWLENLRKQGDVEVLDPTLESPQKQDVPGTGAGGQ
jgi:hypothetical protein